MKAEEVTPTVQALGTRYLEEYSRAVRSYTDFLATLATSARSGQQTGLADSNEIGRRYADFVSSQAPKVLARLSEANISYYTALTDLGLQTLNGYVDGVLRADCGTAAKTGAEQAAPCASLLFHGTREEKAANAFLVTNHRDEAIDVEFDVADVISDDGGERFKPSAEFTPASCRLPPHSERVVQCALTLASPFKPEQDYRGSIQVVGFPEMAMPFTVQVEAPVKDAAPAKTRAAKSTAKTVASKKRAANKTAPRKGG